jgi:hypothetical protein
MSAASPGDPAGDVVHSEGETLRPRHRELGQQRTSASPAVKFRLSLHEVAELTGMRRSTVQSHGERGLARLRGKLGVTDGS